jgi:hypothetical protein
LPVLAAPATPSAGGGRCAAPQPAPAALG